MILQTEPFAGIPSDWGRKAPFRQANLDLMESTLRRHGEALATGQLDAAGFDRLAWREVVDGTAAAYRFALGRAPTDAEAAELSSLLSAQRAYFDRFLGDIRSAADHNFVPARAALYRASGVQGDSAGKVAGLPDEGRITWTGPDGMSSCPECLSYIGRSWSRAEFAALGVRPGSTQCAGNCRCSLSEEAP